MPEVLPTVLVADDEEIVLNFISLILRNAGFTVLSAIGSEKALELMRTTQEPVSLAVLDMVMPNLNGPELFAQLREIYPEMRAVFMSGYNAPQSALPPGCGFLAKPFTALELLRCVRTTAARTVIQRA